MNIVLAVVCLVGLTSAFEDKTVVQYLVDNPEYSTLAGLVSSAGLVPALSSAGPFTVFAPTNAAFNKIDPATLQGLASNTAQLANVLQYHVVNEFVLIPVVAQPTNKTTLEGQDLSISPGGGSLILNSLSKIDAANNDIVVNNGVIQPIDTVLFPPNQASLNIAQILLQDDARFKDVFLALLLSNLTSVLESGDYTMFAPVDSAFAAYKDNLLDPTAPNAQRIYQEVLKYHVVPGAIRANSLSNGQTIYTLHGTSVAITIGSGGDFTLFAPVDSAFESYTGNLLDPNGPAAAELLKYHVIPGGRQASDLSNGQQLFSVRGTPANVTIGAGVRINDANVLDADIIATNGVIHAIDKLLIPGDLN